MAGSIAKAQELRASIPGSIILQQFENPSNAQIHTLTTVSYTHLDVYKRQDQDKPIEDPISKTQVDTLAKNAEDFGLTHFGMLHKKNGRCV